MYNTKEGKSCVIYIRVSSERQVKGYSLDGQKHYLAECAERRGRPFLIPTLKKAKVARVSMDGRSSSGCWMTFRAEKYIRTCAGFQIIEVWQKRTGRAELP